MPTPPVPSASSTSSVSFDPTAFPEVDAAIAASPFTLKYGWWRGTDEEVFARIAPVRWDPDRDGDIVGKHLQAVIEADRPAVVQRMLEQGLPANIAWSSLLNQRAPRSALAMALARGSTEVVTVLVVHGATLTLEEHRTRPLLRELLGQNPRRLETPEQRFEREARVIAVLQGHPQMPRTPSAMERLVADGIVEGIAVDVLSRFLDHGLIRVDGASGARLLTTALRSGHARLTQRLLERGARPDPEDEVPLLTVARTPVRPRDVPSRWEHQAMRSIEALATFGLVGDEPDPEALAAEPAVNARWTALRPLVRAQLWPSRWFNALNTLDVAAVEHALAASGGRVASWCTQANVNALHLLVEGRATRPDVHAFFAVEEAAQEARRVARSQRSDRPALTEPVHRPTDAAPNDADAQAIVLARRLIAQGVAPLRIANRETPGALWAALDLPCPDLARALFDATPVNERNDLVYEAVVKRRSVRALVRLAGFGAPLDSLSGQNGDTAVHAAIQRLTFHDRLPLLLALGASPDRPDRAGRTPLDTVHQTIAGLAPGAHVEIAALREAAVLLETAALRRTLGEPALTFAPHPTASPEALEVAARRSGPATTAVVSPRVPRARL